MDELVRRVDGRTLPHPGPWVFEAGNSEIAFVVKHMMISKVRGVFREFAGQIVVAERPEDSTATLRIRAASLDSGMAARDRDLKGTDFLDVEQHETLDFDSTSVRGVGDGWEVTGDLTIAGVTREVVVAVEFQGAAVDPWGNQKAVFSATAELVREEWGLTYNKTLEGGGVLIGPTAKIEIEIQAKPAAVMGAS